MLVKSYQIKLTAQNRKVKIANGQPVAQFAGGPAVGILKDYNPRTGEGTVVLNTPVHYSALEALGIPWSAFVDYE